MLSRAFEWYRLVNAKPTSETIESRKAAARDVVKAIDDGKDWDLPFDCAAGTIAGFEGVFSQESPVVESLVDAIRGHDSAFPGDLSENALELRVVAALAIGEILVRNGAAPPNDDAVVIAAVLQSGLGIRTAPNGKYLRQLVDELRTSAEKTRASAALSKRKRALALGPELEKLTEPPGDLPAAWKSLIPALKAALKRVAEQSARDREEIDVLWWMFTGASTTTGMQLGDMPVGAAALCCGVELGNQCLLPPAPNAEAMIQQAYSVRRKPKDLSDHTIEAIAAEWHAPLPTALVPTEDDRELVKKYSVLFPLSWLCGRLIDSNNAAGWTSEFEGRTGVSVKRSLSPMDWAIQAFHERVALRLWGQ